MMRTYTCLLACVTGLWLAGACADNVYRWVDAQGHVHYTQTPPPASIANAKAVNIEPPQPDQTSLKQAQDLQQAVSDRQVLNDAQADKAKQAADKQAKQDEACRKARENAQRYQEVRRVAQKGKDGQTQYYSGDDLVKLQQQAQEQADKICGGH